jgi:hypothetical protein
MIVSSSGRYNAAMAEAQTRPAASGIEPDRTEGNRRLTAITAIPLLVLLFVEGLTVLLGVQQQIRVHVFVGMLLIPPIALKLGSVGYRFVRYYGGAPAYRAAGPPSPLMRALGPLVVLTTITLFASGVALITFGRGGLAMTLHKGSFIVWVGAMALHVLGHARKLPGAVVSDWMRRQFDRGPRVRAAVIGASLLVGVGCAALTLHLAGPLGHHHHDGQFGFRH